MFDISLDHEGKFTIGRETHFLPNIDEANVSTLGGLPAEGYSGAGYTRLKLKSPVGVTVFQFALGRLARILFFPDDPVSLDDLRFPPEGAYFWGKIEYYVDPKNSDRSIVITPTS